MANYALDIENTRVASAMEELGIVKEELLLKTIDDFKDPRISYDIQKMRFEHYTKLLKSTINDIRDLLKQRHVNFFPSESKNTLLNFNQGSLSHKNVPEFNKIPPKQRLILRSTLSTFDPSEKLPKALKKPPKSEQNLQDYPKKNYKETFKKYQNLQQAHLNEIHEKEIKSQKVLSGKFSKSMQAHQNREIDLEKAIRENVQRKKEEYQQKFEMIQAKKMMQDQLFEDDIAQKLEKFENKIHKSEEVRSEAISEKVERTLKLRENFEKAQKNLEELKKTNEVEVLKKLVDKHEVVKQHRERNEEEIQKKTTKRKEKFEKLRRDAMDKIQKSEENLRAKSRNSEKNFVRAQQNADQLKMKINEEMMYRKEMKRLKDLECLVKVQRAKRRFGAKNSRSLQRTLEKYQKIDEYKSERERQIYSARDAAIKAMVEKEKVQEAVAVIWKSPRSKTAQEKLKSLNLVKREDAKSDNDVHE